MTDPVDSPGPGWLARLLGIADSAAKGEEAAADERPARARTHSQDDTVDLGTCAGGLSAPAPANGTPPAPPKAPRG